MARLGRAKMVDQRSAKVAGGPGDEDLDRRFLRCGPKYSARLRLSLGEQSTDYEGRAPSLDFFLH